MATEYWLDAGWGCGYIEANKYGIVIESALIFTYFIGRELHRLKKVYSVKALKEEDKMIIGTPNGNYMRVMQPLTLRRNGSFINIFLLTVGRKFSFPLRSVHLRSFL